MNLLENYNTALQALYDHVGFVDDWVVYPIDDCTDYYWATDGDQVKYARTVDEFESNGDFYYDDVYRQRFYTKHIYEGSELAMIFCDPHVDGMKYFRIFDNNKKLQF